MFLASHKLTNGSKVVLKSAKKDDANLAREIHHHRQFLHPHIARLYEVIVTEHLVWLVLEYCPGDELYNHLLEHGRMEASKVQKIFTQLVGAVSFVHGKACVHRDLKLENILLDKQGNVKLVDFGFTREYQGTTSYLQTWCGTVCYAAPEMLRGEKYAGEKVDVWSLGIILYALLCGELPFDEDDDQLTKSRILKEDPKYPEHVPGPALELCKRLLSKRALLRPTLGDILKDGWLAEHAPAQQEILKLQQPAPFSTQLEKDTLQRMKSAGVDIDMVIQNVLSQRCDSLAGWWALLIEKEQRKEKRREQKRKEREAEAKSVRRLSAASGRLMSLGEIHEGEERGMESPRSRGRRMTRGSGSNSLQIPDLPKVAERKTPTPEALDMNRSPSGSRPPPPPKDHALQNLQRAQRPSQSGSVLRVVKTNSELLGPHDVPEPQRRQRKRRAIMQQPLREQLAWVKHWFKDTAAKRGKGPDEKRWPAPARGEVERGPIRDLRRTSTGPTTPPARMSVGSRPEFRARATYPARPSIGAAASADVRHSISRKRTSLSPGTLTPHSSARRVSGLRGRKSTSSSVSSIRSTYQATHRRQSHSKGGSSSTSSTMSASAVSPSGVSSASGSRLGRSPHSSVKVLPSTPTGQMFPSGIRVSRRPLPSGLVALPAFAGDGYGVGHGVVAPGSPIMPVFARRKRSVFKGPAGQAARPAGSRPTSVPRKSAEMIPGITEEEELEEEVEEFDEDHFGPELGVVQGASTATLASTVSPALPALPALPTLQFNAEAEQLEGVVGREMGARELGAGAERVRLE